MSSWFQDRQKQSLFVLLLLVLGSIFYFRRSSDEDPGAIVERAVREMVVAVEKKDLGAFREHLSEEVQDERGRSKQEILQVLRVIYLQNPRISLTIVNLDAQDSTNPDMISADLTLLMGDSIIPDDKGNFNLTFRREDDNAWRVWEVSWGDGARYGY